MIPISSFSKRQILTLVVFSIADFCNAICVSLQAPFYPREAELKGATAAEYGLVFGVFELVVFVISPVYGSQIHRLGPKLMFNGGILTTGICAILFGLLDRVEGHYPFIVLSFVIRVVEAMGNAAFLTASFAIIAMEFPNNVATTFAFLETFFGLGLIVGPTVGGALYELGGYQLPFMVLGTGLFLAALMTFLVLPGHSDQDVEGRTGASLLQVLRIPGVFLAACSIVVTSLSINFLSATLEPHLRQFNFSPMLLGVMFVINGGTYAVTAPFWGWLVDKRMKPKTAILIGCVLLIISFQLVGPAPFLPSPPPGSTELLVTIIIGLVIHGLSIASQLVACFTDALRDAVAHGFPNNIETYGLISGLWTSTFAFGAFIGPSVAGFLYDAIGFRNSTVFVVICGGILGVFVLVFLICTRPKGLYKEVLPDGSEEDLVKKSLGSQNGLSDQYHNFMGSSQSISCAPGMSGYITGNSYRNRLGELHMRQSDTLTHYGSSYGSVDRRASLDQRRGFSPRGSVDYRSGSGVESAA
ncbi:MFS-type transporter SLC18B1-like [Homalodisca vitripennis]|nr:MFS-type transporter SLC18B1-like [Homalodisca vitripennis]